jgi:hypothetical protein
LYVVTWKLAVSCTKESAFAGQYTFSHFIKVLMAYLLQRDVDYTDNQKVCARLVHRCTHTHTHTKGLSFW